MRCRTVGSEDNFFFNDCIVMLNFLKNNVKDTTKILPNELQKPISFQSFVALLSKRIEKTKTNK